MMDIRRILIVFVIGVLFAVLVFSTIDAFYPNPDYEDYCKSKYRAPRHLPEGKPVDCDPIVTQQELDSCVDEGGMPDYSYDTDGCEASWECSTCQNDYDADREKHRFWSFLIASILGLFGIVVSMLMPMKKNSVHEWIGSGLMLGGLFSLFVGTMMYWEGLHSWARPIVILLELLLVIYLSYKRLGPKSNKKS